jgi:hypothetical protein
MKNYKELVLIVCFMSIPVCAYCGDYMNSKDTMVTPYATEKSAKENNSNMPVNTSGTKAAVTEGSDQQVKPQKQVKADSLCMGTDCRNKWPEFKCANYDDRPAGETGDGFCGQMNQTCVAVSIGSGQSFFNECSTSVNTVHKCRCCWVE